MKRTDKRFWKFEALALLSSFITVCIMILLLGPMDMDSFVYLAFVTCLPTYSIGQAFTWKIFKHGNWVNMCISIYLFTAIVFAVELLIVNIIDTFLIEESHKTIPIGFHAGFSTVGLSIYTWLLWLILSIIPSMIAGTLSFIFKLTQKKK